MVAQDVINTIEQLSPEEVEKLTRLSRFRGWKFKNPSKPGFFSARSAPHAGAFEFRFPPIYPFRFGAEAARAAPFPFLPVGVLNLYPVGYSAALPIDDSPGL